MTALPINRETAFRLACELGNMSDDAILRSLEVFGDAIMDAQDRLGMTEDEALDFARRFCQATLNEIVKWRMPPDEPLVLH